MSERNANDVHEEASGGSQNTRKLRERKKQDAGKNSLMLIPLDMMVVCPAKSPCFLQNQPHFRRIPRPQAFHFPLDMMKPANVGWIGSDVEIQSSAAI